MRSHVEADVSVARDAETLLGVARALTDGLPVSLWPPRHLAALDGALRYGGPDAEEGRKARHLSIHLFGDGSPPDLGMMTPIPPRRCDRVRADLAGVVPAGSGLHLLVPTSGGDVPPIAVGSIPVTGTVTFTVALDVVSDLLSTHVRTLGTHPGLVVLVGGTALAAHGVRATSEDVDLHMPEQDDGVVAEVQARHAPTLGPAFRLDVTPADSLWGRMSVRDIGTMPVVAEIDLPGSRAPIRALDLCTLFVLKAAAGRPKDVDDMCLIVPHIDPDALVSRAATMVGWYGDRGRIVTFLDALVTALSTNLGMRSPEVEARLGLREVHLMALAAHRDTLARRRMLAQAGRIRTA